MPYVQVVATSGGGSLGCSCAARVVRFAVELLELVTNVVTFPRNASGAVVCSLGVHASTAMQRYMPTVTVSALRRDAKFGDVFAVGCE